MNNLKNGDNIFLIAEHVESDHCDHISYKNAKIHINSDFFGSGYKVSINAKKSKLIDNNKIKIEASIIPISLVQQFVSDAVHTSEYEWKKQGFLGVCLNDYIKGELYFIIHESCVSEIGGLNG